MIGSLGIGGETEGEIAGLLIIDNRFLWQAGNIVVVSKGNCDLGAALTVDTGQVIGSVLVIGDLFGGVQPAYRLR